MNDDSAARAAMTGIAARAAKAARLLVLDLDWTCGEHHLDVVATASQGTLVVAEARVVAHEPGACTAALAESRIGPALEAGRAWISQHEPCHTELWAVLVTVDTAGQVHVVTGNSAAGQVG